MATHHLLIAVSAVALLNACATVKETYSSDGRRPTR